MKKLKTIFITGAGSGIGRDAAFSLAERGHKVIATTETEVQAAALMDLAKQKNLKMEVYKLDITVASERESLARYDIDVLINDAAIGESGSLAEIPLERVRKNFEVNVFSTLALSQIAIKQMVRKGSGTVLFVSSLAGRFPSPFIGAYSMTKYALAGGVPALRTEMHRVNKNIHISLIEPGAHHTGFNQRMFAKKYEWLTSDSYFHNIQKKLQKEEDRWFKIIEEKSIKGIVRKIVQAAESDKPKLRYVSPWMQGMGVSISRMMGR